MDVDANAVLELALEEIKRLTRENLFLKAMLGAEGTPTPSE